ncbi:hypothetical protein GmHk_14G040694 [Glycine max]|nr:hypothetical protein JHK87_039366 [Glycine soja]KAG4962701.1 hypothetical protein JHK86_039569 [Glycine max]KAG4965172.1 hypothetical protein JHK85_040147 [Glycine max]KAH1212522.1 hypothetical protein GmHk_14G040694 [Glycine max]
MSKNWHYHTLVVFTRRGSPQTYFLLDLFSMPFSFQFLLQWPGSFLCNSLSHFVSIAFFRLVDLNSELGYKM